MFPLSTFAYVKIGLAAIFLFGIFFAGWHTRDRDFAAYKAEIKAEAEKQKAKVESIQQKHELVKKGIQDEYDAKLSLLRQYYANGVRQPSTSNLPGLSSTASIANANTAYSILAGQCSQTTLMLTELQKFINETYAIK